MKLMKGTTRTAVRVGNLVFKFPQYFKYIRLLWKDRGHPDSQRLLLVMFFEGMIGNISEFSTWLFLQSSFLTPTYFSIGLFSIQKFQQGEKPKYAEVRELLDKLPENAKWQMQFVSHHAFDTPNLRKTDQGMKLLDYGDGIGGNEWALATFLIRWHKEFEEIFALCAGKEERNIDESRKS